PNKFVCLTVRPSDLFVDSHRHPRDLHSFPTRRSSDLGGKSNQDSIHRCLIAIGFRQNDLGLLQCTQASSIFLNVIVPVTLGTSRSEEHTSELQSLAYLVCRLLLEKKNNACASLQ